MKYRWVYRFFSNGVIFLVALIFLFSFTSVYISAVSLITLLLLRLFEKDESASLLWILLVIFIAVSILLRFVLSEVNVVAIDLLKPLLVIVVCLTFSRHSRSLVSHSMIWCFLIFIVVTQLAYVFDIQYVIRIIDTYISVDEAKVVWTHRHVNSIGELFKANLRAGGIFRNPNQYAKYLLLFYAFLRVESNGSSRLLTSIVGLSLALTGSRAGMLVFLVYILMINFNIRAMIALIGLYFVVTYFLIDLRVFKFLEGSSSLLGRSAGLAVFFGQENVLTFLLGNLMDEESLSRLIGKPIMFDSGIMLVLWNFGLIGGSFLYFYFFWWLSFYRRVIIWPILLFSVTSGIFFDLSFLMLLVFLLKYYDYKDKKSGLISS